LSEKGEESFDYREKEEKGEVLLTGGAKLDLETTSMGGRGDARSPALWSKAVVSPFCRNLPQPWKSAEKEKKKMPPDIPGMGEKKKKAMPLTSSA